MAQIDLFKIKLNGDSSVNSGGGECPPAAVLSSVTYTENGTYTPTAGVDGYNRVTVDVEIPTFELEQKNVTITENGTQTITPTADYDGLGEVNVTVDVAIPEFELEQKSVTITENGTQTITPSADYDGLGEVNVTVNVATSGGSTSDGFDFSALGYDTTLNNSCNDNIQADIDYSKTLYDEWDNTTTSAFSKFSNSKMVYAPNIDTSNVTNMQYMFNDCASLKVVPNINTSNVTNMSYMFNKCTSLESIPQLDTINVDSMLNMFNGCTSLTTIPLFDTSKVTDMGYMFNGCTSLKSMPQLNTINVASMQSMFNACVLLTTIPQLDTINVKSVSYMFCNCSALQSLPLLDFTNVTNISNFFGYSNITTLTDLGGFKDLKIDWNDNNGLYRCPNLTYESVMNVINNLYDFRGNGDTTTTKTIKFNVNSIALLSESDIAIATNKGWTIS